MGEELPAESGPVERTFAPHSDQKAIEWITVLAAAGLDYRLSLEDGTWLVHVPVEQAGKAAAELEAYEKSESEYERWKRSVSSLEFPFPSDLASPLGVVVFLAACHGILGPASERGHSFELGVADMERIAGGEGWRAVTALTLHMDSGHLLGNVCALGLLGYLVCRLLGGGLGWLLILASGVLGNLAEALLCAGSGRSVGASTAVFGALGILVAYRTTRNLLHASRAVGFQARILLPAGAGVALLALWGGSPGSNVMAHVMGFVVGCVLGVPFSVAEFEWMKGRVQVVMGLAAISVVVGAWYLAGL